MLSRSKGTKNPTEMKARKAFTLVEIMIVVGITGLVLGAAVPNFQQARKSAQDRELQQDLQQIRGAMERFYADQGLLPCNLGWLTHDKVDPSWAYGYTLDGAYIDMTAPYPSRFRGPYIRMPASKRLNSPFFGSHGEWTPISPVPGTSYGYTGTKNSRGEYVWIEGTGATVSGIPYSEL